MADTLICILAGGGALLITWAIVRALPFRKRRYCRGGRSSLVEFLSPFTWFVRAGCGYDLSAHLRGSDGAFPVTCPECGRMARRRRDLLRTPARWRLLGIGAILSMAATYFFAERFFAQTHWDEDLPTWALIQIERWWVERAPIGVRKQLRRRLGTMTAEKQRALAPMFIGDLHSQPDAWQRVDAGGILADHDSPEIRAALRHALQSDDWEQRQRAARILREKNDPASIELLAVTLEALRCDSQSRYGLKGQNLGEARAYLVQKREARGLLRCVLYAIDVQQQQMAAHILIELDEPPTPPLLDALVRGLTRPEAIFEPEARRYLFDEGLPRVVDYFGRHAATAIPYLRDVVRDEIGTARRYAACLLREIDPEIDHEVLVALTDALAFDPWRDDRYIGEQALRRFILYDTFDFLIERGGEAAAALREGMQSNDAQQRVVCAGIAGFAGVEELASQAVPILLEHIVHNGHSDDAVFATAALARLGTTVQPLVAAVKDDLDFQGNEVLIYLLDRIAGRPAVLPSKSDRWGNSWGLVTDRTDDPARLDWRKLDIPEIKPQRFGQP